MDKFIHLFIKFMVTACQQQSEHVVNELLGKKENEMWGVIRHMCDESIYMAALGYCKDGGQDSRTPGWSSMRRSALSNSSSTSRPTGKSLLRGAGPHVDPIGQRAAGEAITYGRAASRLRSV